MRTWRLVWTSFAGLEHCHFHSRHGRFRRDSLGTLASGTTEINEALSGRIGAQGHLAAVSEQTELILLEVDGCLQPLQGRSGH